MNNCIINIIQNIYLYISVLIGSVMGEESLQELRISFSLAESERSGGVSQHLHPFHSIQDVGNIIAKQNYRIPTVYTNSRLLIFDSVYDLLSFL